jgi:hypothetical protein
MELKERLDLFKNELRLISRKDIRDFIEGCIDASPDYIFKDCPSSSSGLYHPIDELAGDGTVVHTKKVFTLTYGLCRALGCDHHRDEVCAAALLHDFAKQGVEKSGHTVKNHPQLMAKIISEVYNDKFKGKLNKESANIIYWCVFHHYGLWTDEPFRKPLGDYTTEELCLYLSDYVVSKRFVKIDYIRKDGFGLINTENNEKKFEVLSGLLNYISKESLEKKINVLKSGDKEDLALANYFKNILESEGN